MLQNIGATYGLVNFGEGNPMYSIVADEYRKDNPMFGEPMSEKSFCIRFGVINE